MKERKSIRVMVVKVRRHAQNKQVRNVKVRRKVKIGKSISSEAGKTGKNIKVRRKVQVDE